MKTEKNGYEFEIEIDELEIDKEGSHERSNYNGYDTALLNFHMTVTKIEEMERFNYGLVGTIEYSTDRIEIECDDGFKYRPYITLNGGDVQDQKFNSAIRAYFDEEYPFEQFVWDNLTNNQKDIIEELIK